MSQPIIEAINLSKYFEVGKGKLLKAVDDVSFRIMKGETLGLVGESGCGKTTCGRTLCRMYDPTAGEVLFHGQPVSQMRRKELLQFRKSAQMIFQDPYSALDPRMTIAEIISEGMEVHFTLSSTERNNKVNELLAKVGLTEEYANRFPHELSGGQRQRIGIARTLAVEPEFIVCDEPISALDVSIQAQIVNLLIKLQHESGLTYLFISHDLSMVRHISDRIGVMYLGNLVELADSRELFDHAKHPYTKALISAIPMADPEHEKQRKREKLQGEVPSPINPPPGCRFRGRCPFATDICANEPPLLREIRPNHFVACHNLETISD